MQFVINYSFPQRNLQNTNHMLPEAKVMLTLEMMMKMYLT